MGKKHHEQHEEEGEGWLVSYADLMTLLFGFFVIMYKASSDTGSTAEIERKLGEALVGFERPVMEHIEEAANEERQARAFQLLLKMVELDPRTAVSDIEKKYSEQQSAKALKDVFAKKMGEEGPQDITFRADDALHIVIPTDAGFQSGSAQLTPAAQQKLKDITGTLFKMKDIVRLEVVGHTDDQPPRVGGTWSSNWDLSAARAASVGTFLQNQGVSSANLRIAGAADSVPLIPIRGLNGPELEAARKQNRRIELLVSRKMPEEKP